VILQRPYVCDKMDMCQSTKRHAGACSESDRGGYWCESFRVFSTVSHYVCCG